VVAAVVDIGLIAAELVTRVMAFRGQLGKVLEVIRACILIPGIVLRHTAFV
jgi:hypothetical protein